MELNSLSMDTHSTCGIRYDSGLSDAELSTKVYIDSSATRPKTTLNAGFTIL